MDGFIPDKEPAPSNDGFVPDEKAPAQDGFIPDAQPVAAPASQEDSAGEIKKVELAQIAKKHGVDPSRLEWIVPIMGVNLEGMDVASSIIARTGGLASEGIGMGAIPFAYKKLVADDKEEAAIDDLRKLADERKTGIETAMELGTGLLVPGIGAGKAMASAGKLAKVAEAAAVGAGYGAAGGLFKSKAGEELKEAGEGALVGGAFGGALGVASAALSRAGKPSKDVKLVLGEMGERGQKITEKAQEIAQRDSTLAVEHAIVSNALEFKKPEVTERLVAAMKPSESLLERMGGDEAAAKAFMAQKVLDKETMEFAKYLTGRKPKTLEQASKYLSKLGTEGEESLSRKWMNYLEGEKATTSLIRSGVIEKLPPNKSFIDRAGLFMSDALNGAAQRIDERLGTNIAPTILEGTERYNAFMFRHAALHAEMRPQMEAALSLPENKVEELYKGVTEGRIAELSDDLRPLAESYATKFKELASMTEKEFGVNVRWKENYLPQMPKDSVDVAALIGSRWEQAGKNTAAVLAAETPELAQLKQGLEFLAGRPIKTEKGIEKALADAMNPVVIGERQNTQARFFNERTGVIPDFLLEKNPAKLLQAWSNSTFRHLYMRDTIDDLTKAARMALKMGDVNAANYVTNHLKDLSGIRQGTLSSWTRNARMRWQTAMLQKAEESESPLAQKAFKWMAAAPEANSLLLGQIYPNFLGLSPKAVFQNLTQPLLMTVPELGWGYGSKKLMEAYADLAAMKSGAGSQMIRVTQHTAPIFGLPAGSDVPMNKWADTLLRTGKVTQRFNQEMGNELAKHLQDSALFRHTSGGLQKMSELSMYFFEKAETLNRMTTGMMAMRVADDLAKGVPEAVTFVNNMGSSYRRGIMEALQRGEAGRSELSRLMSNYLVGKTMFNYNRLTMSEYGRFMGPVMSVFTKWPTSIAGDVINEYTKRGMLGGTQEVGRKYLAPLALLYVAGAATHDATQGDALWETLMGKQGLEGLSPLASAKGLVTGEMAAPPAVSIPRDIGMGLATADMYKIYRAANEAFNAFTPVVPMLARTMVLIDSLAEDRPVAKGTLLNKVATMMGAGEPDKAVKDFAKDMHDKMFGN